ncbi:MAG: addiction module killer protein [Rhodospirillales bacterium]|nr:addiction module killer protein [Rhodospirillales bacterium]
MRDNGEARDTAKEAGSGVSERRMDFGPGYRTCFGSDGAAPIVLPGGGAKSRRQQDVEATPIPWCD